MNSINNPYTKVGIPQWEAQSATFASSAIARFAKRFNVLFLVVAQLALRFKQSK